MAVFELLSDTVGYNAETWDLSSDKKGQDYWLNHFEGNFQTTLEAARESLVTDRSSLTEAIESAQREFKERLTKLRDNPELRKTFGEFVLERLRREVLNSYGLRDPFLKIKHQENIKACGQYRRLIKAHERLDAESLVRVLTEGIFAGNVFDLGPESTVKQYNSKGLDFYRMLDELPSRPWLVDDYDNWEKFFNQSEGTLKRVMFFVDNAGCDFILGCLPLARVLAKRGATVTLAANDEPSLNDITLAECRAVLKALARDDDVLEFLLRTERLKTVGTGNAYPLIDFKQISRACNEAAKDTDLLIIEGMGRAVESNWQARFKCTTLKIAMIKDEWVAQKMEGKCGDLVCRFEEI